MMNRREPGVTACDHGSSRELQVLEKNAFFLYRQRMSVAEIRTGA
jgi:hypothetical protein